ncbi:hypothetical protein GQ457_01G028080 [Hibiscus cannabinus]
MPILIDEVLRFSGGRTSSDDNDGVVATAELAGKTPPTAPNKVQRLPTARITFGTIKQASMHQEKANASLYNIIMIKNCLSA